MENTQEIPIRNVAVVGASGAIGGALIDLFSDMSSVENIYAFSRKDIQLRNKKVKHAHLNYNDENTIKRARATLPKGMSLDILVIATGMLHMEGVRPEKSINEFDSETSYQLYLNNTLGPSLIMKHFWDALNSDRKSILAAIGARVGSITDNKLGGWYSYRSSKAALCMTIKSMSIEMSRRNKHMICVALHPGTVDSKLSQPFQRHIDQSKIMTPHQSAQKLIDTIFNLSSRESGNHFAYDGSLIEP